MAENARPLSDDERRELEALRAEKAAREQRERDARERAELEELRAEQERAVHPAPVARQTPSGRSASAARTQSEEERRIAEARERGARLMEPDDDLRMPVGQKIVLGVLALLVLIVIGMTLLLG